MPRQYSQSTVDNNWQVLILLSQHWQHLRPEKAWRPIICLELDGRPCHELILGVDGQNPNLREPALLHDAHHASKLVVRIYYQGTGKSTGKSKKKRKEVASCVLGLREAFEKQGNERHLEVRLSGITSVRKKSDAQKPQPCASLFVRVRPPQSFMVASTSGSETLVDDRETSRAASPLQMSDPDAFSNYSSEPEEELPEPSAPGLRRRRRVIKGFAINSDDELSEYYISDDCSPIDSKSAAWPSCPGDDDAEDIIFIPPSSPPSPITIAFPNLLPLQRVGTTMSVASTSSLSMMSSAYDTFTYYRELREAQHDAELEILIARLVREWQYVGATLLSSAALTTTVFGFSPGTIFGVDGIAVRALTISAVSSAIGLLVDAFLLFSYIGADVRKFQTLAVGVYSDYFFFALTSRLPLLFALVALVSLSAFLLAVAFAAWPGAVLWISALSGVLVSLQYLVKGTELCVRGIRFTFIMLLSCGRRRAHAMPTRNLEVGTGGECRDEVEIEETSTGVHIVARPAGVLP